MPEDPLFKATSTCTDDGYVVRHCKWSSGGKLMSSQLLLPPTISEAELQARNERALEACEVWRRIDESEQANQNAQEHQVSASRVVGDVSHVEPAHSSSFGPPKFSSREQDLDVQSERVWLKRADQDAQYLFDRQFHEVVSILDSRLGCVHVPVYAWEEPLKLIQLAASTPDRDVHRRGKELYRRIRSQQQNQSRSVGYPLASHEQVLIDLENIRLQMPHFAEVLVFVKNCLALSFARKQPMSLPPILLLGDPGIGKTHFTLELAKALRVPVHRHSFDSGLTESALTGSDSHWGNTSTGLMFEAIVLGQSASPIVLLDEIDKARKGDRTDPVAPLHSLLEPVSARAIKDISVNFTFDASHVVWIATGNEAAYVPATVRSRFREFVIDSPSGGAAIKAAHTVTNAVYQRMGSELFDPIDKCIVVALAHLSAREQIHALEMSFAQALASSSRTVQLHHLPHGLWEAPEGEVRLKTEDGSPPSSGYLH